MSNMIPGVDRNTSYYVRAHSSRTAASMPSDSLSPSSVSTSTSVGQQFGHSTSQPPKTIVEVLNHKLYPQGLEAVFQFDTKSRLTWVNVVNKATGQVVEKWPPERIRQMVDQADTLPRGTRSLSYEAKI